MCTWWTPLIRKEVDDTPADVDASLPLLRADGTSICAPCTESGQAPTMPAVNMQCLPEACDKVRSCDGQSCMSMDALAQAKLAPTYGRGVPAAGGRPGAVRGPGAHACSSQACTEAMLPATSGRAAANVSAAR